MRVIVADDAVLFREGIARVLAEAGFEVLGRAQHSAELIDLVGRHPPDVVITDLRMPPGFANEGIEAAAEIRSFAPQVGLMLLSQYVEVHHVLRLIEEFDGAVGYLLKDRVSDLGAFAVDVRRVAAGEVVIDPELVSRLVARRRERDPPAELTERERQEPRFRFRRGASSGCARCRMCVRGGGCSGRRSSSSVPRYRCRGRTSRASHIGRWRDPGW